MFIDLYNGYGTTYHFEVVKNIPYGYKVWNLGRKNFPFNKMIPLCQTHGYNVYVDTLKAYECPSEEIALKIMDEAQHQTVEAWRIIQLLEHKE